MHKNKKYQRTRFRAEVLREAIELFEQITETSGRAVESGFNTLSVTFSDETWRYDKLAEFLADYRKGVSAKLRRDRTVFVNDTRNEFSLELTMYAHDHLNETEISVSAPTREQIQEVFEVFEKHAMDSRLPEPEEEKVAPNIFIGHGHSEVWRDLKDHLHEKHEYIVEAYETGERAGHAVRNILEGMMSKSAFALLVLTCDDDVGDGKYRARQNVIHEAGLFQGRLGFSRAIILLEEGVDLEDFSNIEGIHQIRFSKGNIRETYGDVLATLRREFGAQN